MEKEQNNSPSKEAIQLFVQVEGRSQIAIVRVPKAATVQDLLDEVLRMHLLESAIRDNVFVFIEDSDDDLRRGDLLAAVSVKDRCRVHMHRCRRIRVAIHFNGVTKEHTFAPSVSITTVTAWATGPHGFNLTPTDAVEHVLQISGSSERPDEDVHLGTLTRAPDCHVSFDLVPKRRVEG